MVTRQEVARLIDHTLLRSDATTGDIDRFVGEALELGVLAVCVEGRWVKRVASQVTGVVRVVTVAGFPTGLVPTAEKAEEARIAVAAGADEVDMVANLEAIGRGDFDEVTRDIRAVRAAVDREEPGTILKVILETASLDPSVIGDAAQAAERGGADFVKTSTGFHPAGGASIEAVKLLHQAVGGRLGVKASGGIASSVGALALIEAGATRLGTSRTRDVLDGWWGSYPT